MNTTRARLCELVASRILRRYDEDNIGPEGLLPLANVLVSGFAPFQNAPEHVVDEYKDALQSARQNYRGYITALELAIISDSKMFLSSASCQKVMEAIYVGRVVYTPTTFIDMLPDHYKHKRILLYNPRKAPLLDHYRLRVPRTRNVLGILQFMILLLLYILVMQSRDDANTLKIPAIEFLFWIYSLGWVLEQIASMLEHGWQVYTQNLWSFLDVTFTTIYLIYFAERIRGHMYQDEELSKQSMDILSMAAPVLIPRLAFNLLSENMLFISLRDMMVNFAILTFLAVWCFLGFFLAMNWMSQGESDPKPHEISKWMLWIWFGLDGTGIQRSADFHWFLGPLLMVMFAFLGNTLFLTILVSMLSSTFSNIVNNANAEIQYRRSVMTFEGVKSDAIFSFMPPFNILALFGLLPLKLMLSPRWFHKVVVFSTRAFNAPILLLIGLYERHTLLGKRRFQVRKTRRDSWFPNISKLAVHADIQMVFEAEPPQSVLEDSTRPVEDGPEEEPPIFRERERSVSRSRPRKRNSILQPRKESVAGPFAELAEYLHDYFSDSGALSGGDQRLETMEASMAKIEEQVQKICERLDGGHTPPDSA